MTPMQQDQQNQPPPQAAAAAPTAAPAMGARATGALLLGIGVALEGLNVATLMNDSTYYPKLLIIGAGLIPYGFWSLVTGITYDKNMPVKPPIWWTLGAIVMGVGGILAGVAASVAISD